MTASNTFKITDNGTVHALVAAEHLLDIGRPQLAYRHLAPLARVCRRTAYGAWLESRTLLQLGELRRAERRLDRALAAWPRSLELLDLRADCHWHQAEYAAAEMLLLRTIFIAPDEPYFRRRYAELARAAEQPDKAMALLAFDPFEAVRPSARAEATGQTAASALANDALLAAKHLRISWGQRIERRARQLFANLFMLARHGVQNRG